MMEPLDCVVIGYNEGDFQGYRAMCQGSGAGSPTLQDICQRVSSRLTASRCRGSTGSAVSGTKWQAQRPLPWGEVHNLAGLYLSGHLRKAGLTAEAISLFTAEQARLADLLTRRPLVVAVTTTFYVNIVRCCCRRLLGSSRKPTSSSAVR